MGKRSARPSRTTSRCALQLGNRDGKRMPEYDPLHVARSTLQENCKCLRAIGRIECETVLGCEPLGRLPFRGRVAVALPQPVHDVEGAGSGERYCTVREQPPGGVREPRCSPAVSDDPWCDADAHDARRPAEYSDGEGEARSSTAGAEWEDDRVRRAGELAGELQSRERSEERRVGKECRTRWSADAETRQLDVSGSCS